MIPAFARAGVRAVPLYVSPGGDDSADGASPDQAVRTIRRARDLLRERKQKGELTRPVRVILDEGLYTLRKPIRFSPEDSGTEQCPITYAAARNTTPRLSGGRRITGWKEGEDGIWTAEVPEAKGGRWDFRQLYVDGKLRLRARDPNEGFHRVAGFPDGGRDVHYHTDCKRFEYDPGDLNPEWKNLRDVEVIVYHFWTDSHLPIAEIDTENHIVTFQHKAGKVFTDDFSSDGARYIVENVFEALDVAGEWYLDKEKGLLHYKPYPEENLRTAEVIAPVAPALLILEGNPGQGEYVHDLHFENLEMMHTNFVLPPGNSNDRQGSSSVPAAIRLRGAQDCSFRECTVSNLGTFAFEMMDGCSHNLFQANLIEHVAAGGFRIDGGEGTDSPLLRTHDNTLSDNELAYYGDYYPSAVGILLMNTSSNRVIHNAIHHGWYTGISLGWEWGYQRSIARDNLVAHNHIHHIGQGLLSDMGAIYTLGVSPGTIIRHNRIHDIESNHYGGWGIYNDEGSSHILIEKNIVYNTKFAGYNIHFAKEITVRNNIFAFGKLEQISRGRVEPHISVFFENNIIYWVEGELFAKSWRDKTYQFHFHPKNKEGTRSAETTFTSDWNVFYNPNKKLEEVDFNGRSFEQWRSEGKDRHSVYADPKFVDASSYDFRLQDDSPALELGFEPIETEGFGPRFPPGG
jgi:hypothetical protein